MCISADLCYIVIGEGAKQTRDLWGMSIDIRDLYIVCVSFMSIDGMLAIQWYYYIRMHALNLVA